MATLTLKNVPDELYARLKQSATEHCRSINSEAIACLERVLRRRPFDPEAFLVDVRALRRRIGRFRVTDRDINAAKRRGRP